MNFIVKSKIPQPPSSDGDGESEADLELEVEEPRMLAGAGAISKIRMTELILTRNMETK